MKIQSILTLILSLFSTALFAQDTDNEVVVETKLLGEQCSRPRNHTNISHIMLHFCSDAYQNPKTPYNLERIVGIFEQYKVSAHYLIGRDGTIYQLVKEDRVAHHAGKGKLPTTPHHQNSLNGRSIGIEMMAVGEREEMKKLIPHSVYDQIPEEHIGFTEAQYEALNKLLDMLTERYEIERDRTHIVGHDEYAPTRRCDPGSLFDWQKLGL